MRFLTCLIGLVALLLLATAATASDCYGYRSSYSYPTYYGGGVYDGRYFPSGHYSWIGGRWYRHGYGYEYGSYVSHCPPVAVAPIVPAPIVAPPAEDPTAQLLRQLIVQQQVQQLLQQPAAPAPAAYQAPAGGLTAQEVQQLRVLLRQLTQEAPRAAMPKAD